MRIFFKQEVINASYMMSINCNKRHIKTTSISLKLCTKTYNCKIPKTTTSNILKNNNYLVVCDVRNLKKQLA